MQQDSIERIRSATFSISRKGYDKREVERFLNKLADWLETGGGDQARTDLVKRELERVGEKTSGILSQAEDSAEQLRAEAQQQASEILGRAKQQAESSREAADDYAGRTRHAAESKARRIVDEGVKRRQDIDAVISDLERRREALLAGLKQLTNELNSVVAGYSDKPGMDRHGGSAERGSEAPAPGGEPAEAPVRAEKK